MACLENGRAVESRDRRIWGGPSLQVVLYQPEIPQNTGNVARTCAATHTPLHLVEPLGFRITDRHLKRAGLDYWPHVTLAVHPDIESLRGGLPGARWVFFSTHACRSVYEFRFQPGDCLVFGCETGGLPKELLDQAPLNVLQIPIDRSQVRSLNLATSVGVALFEAMRQLMFSRRLSASSHGE
jgi:tRNA (cytidine/uridine-2'-O-)-methyltransferase